MADDQTRAFSTPRGDRTVRIHAEKLSEHADLAPPRKAKHDRKFNLRIRQDDICLLDALAQKEGMPRSALINALLHDFLLDELMSVTEIDARVLLAETADARATYDPLAQPWAHDALSGELKFIRRNVEEGNDALSGQPPEIGFPVGHKLREEDYRSPAYIGLRDKLKGLSR